MALLVASEQEQGNQEQQIKGTGSGHAANEPNYREIDVSRLNDCQQVLGSLYRHEFLAR
jgi:hypothetical protein